MRAGVALVAVKNRLKKDKGRSREAGEGTEGGELDQVVAVGGERSVRFPVYSKMEMTALRSGYRAWNKKRP